MRRKRLFYNTGTAILNQLITLICGFILPRQIILYFGSATNGLVSSITQFLSIITLLDMGVGAVVQAALYKPLATGDNILISRIIKASKKFFGRIGYILIIYTIVLMFFFPVVIDNSLGYVSTAILVFSISISSVAQYFFGITNQLLLNADQKSYVQLLTQSLVTALNTIVSVALIFLGFDIVVVKLVASVVLMLRPLILWIYVRRKYTIDNTIDVPEDPLPQKWNAMAQHIATFIVDRTDVVVLTLLSTLTNVSIYYVYHLVVNGLYQAFSVMLTGIQSLLGDMFAKEEHDKIQEVYSLLEWISHTIIVFLFGCCFVLILPFVNVYTQGVNDANYIQPLFAYIITFAFGFCCLKAYYNLVIKAVGHFKQTQTSAIIEAVMNIVISVACVWQLGLVGVAVGTLVAMLYRTIYYIYYINKTLIKRKRYVCLKQFAIDALTFFLLVFISHFITYEVDNYITWFVFALIVVLIALVLIAIVNAVFYRRNLKRAFTYAFSSIIKKMRP